MTFICGIHIHQEEQENITSRHVSAMNKYKC